MTTFASIEEALDALRGGRPVLVLDDAHRENEGDVILAGQTLTDSWLAWTIRHSSGYVCAPMPEEFADRLGLPLMVRDTEDRLRTAYTITVDAAAGVSTGISAADRAQTIRTLADPACEAAALVRPGHVVPLRARDGGVLVRRGHTEAGVDLCRLAGLAPVAAIAELTHDDGTMMRLPAVAALAAEHDVPVITIEQLVAYRQRHDRVVRHAVSEIPTADGVLTTYAYRDVLTGDEHLALVSPRGVLHDGRSGGVLVRVHSECLTGDVLGSTRCDCGPQLRRAQARIAREGGVVVYVRGHEGRGVGLANKIAAYAVQDSGVDTVTAQEVLGLPVDNRDYTPASAILHDLGVTRVRLMTNNPDKVTALSAAGIEVAAVERHEIAPVATNALYLQTKRDRLGHDLVLTPPADLDAAAGTRTTGVSA